MAHSGCAIALLNHQLLLTAPDLKVSAELALKTAHLAALKELLAKTTEPEFVEELKRAIG